MNNMKCLEMVRDRGFEPLTPSVSRKCSSPELTAQPADRNALARDALLCAISHSQGKCAVTTARWQAKITGKTEFGILWARLGCG